MAKAKKVEEKINLESILFKCRDILRAARGIGNKKDGIYKEMPSFFLVSQ